MPNISTWITDQLVAYGLSETTAGYAALLIGLAVLLVLAWLGNLIAKRVILRAVLLVTTRTTSKWDDAFAESRVFSRLSHLVPAMVISAFGDVLLGESPGILASLDMAVTIYLALIWLGVFFALLNAGTLILKSNERTARMPIRGFVQALKLVATLIALLMVLSAILDRPVGGLLAGLGALTAVLLLVFRDAILGFVAGIMISTNNLVQVGDWIEMPKAGADGDVIDVSLTTVKVRNWDKTITSIPTYTLISDSFKNWRGMSETGGRRIKRALLIDQQTIRFADPGLIDRWEKVGLLRDYLHQKRQEIDRENRERGTDMSILGNGRRITNIGTFRAYCVAYLRAHPKIRQDLTFLVRQLAPTEHGLPIEIYVFTNDTRWAVYEGIQADIFDHLLAVIGEFDLRVYQAPSGHDFHSALGGGK